ncbi:aminotransferase class IV [Alkaliphilus sp. B6464]|uniref:aminotransferase class IV n=1 Tax=Alkaliphilus sp. B6464 TaxID=2731219 RepID=UPI001BA59CC8|nr:aminotransferase class IV [Alkaliphilus sp. B6464]QUH19002.1 aminotransferase class IV [Alkaliphilus sp. B6464]
MYISKNSNKEIAQSFFLLNGQVTPSSEFEQEKTTIYPSFYEVIRVINGVPLFFEEHIQRLIKSLDLLNYKLPYDENTIKEQIHTLIESNKCYNYNVKIVINGLNDEETNLFIYFITSNYPNNDQYTDGVHTILYEAERENPNAKVIAKSFRDAVNKSIKESNAYEAILVNQNKEITEGSRSNMFFVKDNIFYTSPAKDVLVGITRSRVIQLCVQLGYEVKEEPIPVSFLDEIDGLFLTGTSPNVLPIASINNTHYESSNNPAILTLSKAYDDLINNYIAKNKESMA